MPSRGFKQRRPEIIQSSLPHSRSCLLPYFHFAPKASNPAPSLSSSRLPSPAASQRDAWASAGQTWRNRCAQRCPLSQPSFIVLCRGLDVHKLALGVSEKMRLRERRIVQSPPVNSVAKLVQSSSRSRFPSEKIVATCLGPVKAAYVMWSGE